MMNDVDVVLVRSRRMVAEWELVVPILPFVYFMDSLRKSVGAETTTTTAANREEYQRRNNSFCYCTVLPLT